jgi:alkaline phosphatase
VDWAGHANDPIYMTTDFLAFDEAVKVACDFADQDRRTLVLAYPDHNTGGMKLGHYETAVGYTETTVEDLVEPLKGMKITSSGLVAKMPEEPTDADIVSAVEAWWGLSITQDDVDEIRALEPYVGLGYALSRVISKNHTVVGWTTHGHNGETVPLWVYGGKAPAGIIDNTMLAEIAADAIGVDLERLTNRLYLDLGAFTSYEIEVSTDADGQIIDNGVVKVGGWELPISKDYMEKDGNRIQLPGLTVYASGDANIPEKVYVSRKALRIMGLL